MSSEQTVMTKVALAMAEAVKMHPAKSGVRTFTKTHPVFPFGQVVELRIFSLFRKYYLALDGCGIVAAVEQEYDQDGAQWGLVWVYSPHDGNVYPITQEMLIAQPGEKF